MNIILQKPNLSNIPKMQEISKIYVENGKILKRDDNEMANTIRSYLVAKTNDDIVGFGALHIYSVKLAEIRSLIVKRGFQNRGIGKSIVKGLLKEAVSLGLKEILVLTYEADFFKKMGFKEIPKEKIPNHKVWEDCIKCKLFPICNELALIKNL